MKLRKNKRASIFDTFGVLMILLVFVIVTIASFSIFSSMQPTLESTLNNSVSTHVLDKGESTLLSFDKAFIFILGGLIMASMIGAFMVDTHPAFFVMSVLLLAVFMIVSAIIANAVDDMLSLGFSSAYNQYPIMTYYIQNLPTFIAVIGGLIAIALYIKMSAGGGV